MKGKKDFGSFIKEKRIEKGYSQKDLAELLFVTESAVSKWERGVTYPDITLITDLCRVLDVTEHELIQSGNDVEYRKMKRDAEKYNKTKKSILWTLNICYAIALLTCFIVNLAVNHTLSWFFIVLTSLLCGYSFCPTFTWLVRKFKKVIFIGSSFLSMFLLFLTISIYTSNYWFMIPTIAVLLGYFIIFYPILFKAQAKYLDEDKYSRVSKYFMISYVGIMYILVNLLLVVIYSYSSYNIWLAFMIASGCFIIPIIFGIFGMFNIFGKIIKPLIISLFSIITIVLIVGISRSFYLFNNKETNTYVIIEEYNNLSLEVGSFDVNLYLSDDNETKVVCTENDKIKVETTVNNGILKIKKIDNRKFYDMIFNFGKFEIDIYLAKENINEFDFKGSTSDIEINKGFIFNDINIDNSTGDVEIKSSINNNLTIKLSTGVIKLSNINVGGNVSLESSTGDKFLENLNCKKLDIVVDTGKTTLVNVLVSDSYNHKGDTGDVVLDNFDAGNIIMDLDTGSVKGNILTSKFFVVRTSTGDVIVPETKEGGDCRITTSTGDVYITLGK